MMSLSKASSRASSRAVALAVAASCEVAANAERKRHWRGREDLMLRQVAAEIMGGSIEVTVTDVYYLPIL